MQWSRYYFATIAAQKEHQPHYQCEGSSEWRLLHSLEPQHCGYACGRPSFLRPAPPQRVFRGAGRLWLSFA